MRSSELNSQGRHGWFALPALWALFALGACVGTTPISSTDSPPLAISDCARIGETASAQQVADAAALLAATERGPLFTTLKAASSTQNCRVRFEPGTVEIYLRMTDGSWLRVARDSRIELYEQEARLAVPLSEEPTAWLRRAAVAAFGDGACGIDWRASKSNRLPTTVRLPNRCFAATCAIAKLACAAMRRNGSLVRYCGARADRSRTLAATAPRPWGQPGGVTLVGPASSLPGLSCVDAHAPDRESHRRTIEAAWRARCRTGPEPIGCPQARRRVAAGRAPGRGRKALRRHPRQLARASPTRCTSWACCAMRRATAKQRSR